MKRAMMAVAVAAAALAGGQAMAQDAAAGKKVFNQCRACHVVDKEQNRVGPHLVGIVGRPVGSIDGYKYSSAMTGWGEGKTWTVEQLTEYLADPKGVVPGTKMAYRGVKKEADLANLIAYLEAPGS